MNFQTLNKQRKFILIAALAGIIAVFLPWVTISAGFLGSQSVNGFRGIGILAFLSFVLAGAFSLVGEQANALDKTMWMLALGASALALLSVIIAVANTLSGSGGLGFVEAGVGFGLWIAVAASVGVVLSAWLLKTPGDSIKSGFDSLKQNPLVAPRLLRGPGSPSSTSPSSRVTANPGKLDELERLIEMKNKGSITEEEYQLLKSRIL